MIFIFIRFYISLDIQDLNNEYSFIVKKIFSFLTRIRLLRNHIVIPNWSYQILKKEGFEIGESRTQIMQIVYSGLKMIDYLNKYPII